MTSICRSKLDRLQTTKTCTLIYKRSTHSLLKLDMLQWLTDVYVYSPAVIVVLELGLHRDQ